MEEKQMLLLVEENDTFSGKYAEKERCHIGIGLHHRAFVVLLLNKNDEILLQKRKHKLWDGYWDITATSHVLHLPDHDETYDEAALRALKDEMSIKDLVLEKVGGFNYFAKEKGYCENEYCAILIGEYNGLVFSNKEVVYEYKWMSKTSFLDEIREHPQKYTPWAIKTASELLIPLHVAIIMDGNRRWARQHGLPITLGHTKGYRRMQPLIKHAMKQGIKYLTFWAFSTENWNRNKKEIDFLMGVFRKLFKRDFITQLKKNGVKINILGELDPFPKDIQEGVKKLLQETKDNKSIVVNIGLNYGGRQEILRAVKKLLKDKPRILTEETFSQHLYTKGQPDPALIIRTGGEERLSGYLPWQSVYSELYFTKTYWPDFDEKEFDRALEEFYRRERRFGK